MKISKTVYETKCDYSKCDSDKTIECRRCGKDFCIDHVYVLYIKLNLDNLTKTGAVAMKSSAHYCEECAVIIRDKIEIIMEEKL
jgi:hypothetical protein